MDEPLVSIVCISYNQEKYIKDTLDGFVMQKTEFPFEIVISDDCSMDNTRRIIADYKYRYPDLIRDVSPDKNKGMVENWKHVHIKAKGEYVAFCEGDDYWTDSFKLQKQIEYMLSHPACGLCVTDFRYQNDLDNDHVSEPAFASLHTFQPQTFMDHLNNAGYIGPMTWLYKRSLFMDNVESYMNITDATLALALDLFGSSEVFYLPDVTAVYRVHSDSAANPLDNAKRMTYIKGVYSTQVTYAQKYNCDQEMIDNLKIQNYAASIPLAIECDDQNFIADAMKFYADKGINMKWFIESCKKYVGYKKQYEQIRSSKAYRLGKTLLKPFKWLRKK